jgi:hypothetical protein
MASFFDALAQAFGGSKIGEIIPAAPPPREYFRN